MTRTFAKSLGFISRLTSFEAQKIDSMSLKISGIVSTTFFCQDSYTKVQFFEKTFLLADTTMKMVLGMPFLSLSNVDIEFHTRKITLRICTTIKVISTVKIVE